MFNYIAFSNAIKSNLKYADNFRDLGKRIGVSASTISRAIKANSTLDIDTVLKICKWLKQPITNFID